MSHGLDTNQKAASAAPVIRPLLLARLDFVPLPVLVHSGIGTINYGGEDYLGIGSYGSVSGVKEGIESRPYDIQMTLSGIPTDYLSETMNEQYQGRAAHLAIALLNEDHQQIGTPKIIWKGKMDYPDIELGETAKITVSCRGRMADWDRPRIRRYSQEDQQSRYPDDNFFKYVAAMVDKTVIWGRS